MQVIYNDQSKSSGRLEQVEKMRGRITRDMKKFGDDICIQYLDCGDGFTGANYRLNYV